MRIARTVGLAVLALGLLAGGAYTAVWYAAAVTLEDGIRTWAAEAHPGLAVAVGDVAVEGFPLRMDATIGRVEITGEELQARYTAEGVEVVHTLWGGGTTFTVRGPQTMEFAGKPGVYQIDARRFEGSLRQRTDGSFGGFALDVVGLALKRPRGATSTAERIAVQVAIPDGPGAVPSGTRLAVRVEGAVLPEHRRGPFGDTIAAASATLEIEGALGSLALGKALPQWQQVPGKLYVSEANVRWGTLDLPRLAGTVRLDQALKPAGWLDVVFRDPAPVFEALAAAGWISRETLVELLNGTRYDPNRAMLKVYRASFLDGTVVIDDIEQDQTAPIPLWALPPLAAAPVPPEAG